MKTFKPVILAALTALATGFFPAAAEAVEQDLIFGGYVLTIKNLSTRGALLSYRLWFTPPAERSDRFSLIHPRPFTWGFEAKGGKLNHPEEAWEAMLALKLKYELEVLPGTGFFATLGGGGSYSEADYHAVPTKYSFVGRAGLGWRLDHFLVQAVFEHRSNGGIRRPNRGVDLLEAGVGFRF